MMKIKIMEPFIPRLRKPVAREGAERYLLFTLLSFAASVSLTRLFLDLTGYPQLGGGDLHIAHVLWGGLLLFIGALLPLLYVNRWALFADSILAGAGVGLFIDEVGKFITSTNDYFYPPAAPIIYAFFLITLLLYMGVRKPKKRDTRTELFTVLNDLEEVLDEDLSERERARILDRLNRIEHNSHNADFTRLIKELQDFISYDTLYLVPHRPGLVERSQARWKRFEDRWVNRRGLQIALAGALIFVGLWALVYPIAIATVAYTPTMIGDLIVTLVQGGFIRGPGELAWFEIRLVLQLTVGLILFVSGVLFAIGRDRQATGLSYLGLLISITMVNLLMFYFDQFSTIVIALVEFVLLLAIIYYRRHYLHNRLV